MWVRAGNGRHQRDLAEVAHPLAETGSPSRSRMAHSTHAPAALLQEITFNLTHGQGHQPSRASTARTVPGLPAQVAVARPASTPTPADGHTLNQQTQAHGVVAPSRPPVCMGSGRPLIAQSGASNP